MDDNWWHKRVTPLSILFAGKMVVAGVCFQQPYQMLDFLLMAFPQNFIDLGGQYILLALIPLLDFLQGDFRGGFRGFAVLSGRTRYARFSPFATLFEDLAP